MLPSGEASTAVTAAHFTPGGSSPQSRVVRYGCGRSFRGASFCWARMEPHQNPTTESATSRSVRFIESSRESIN